MDCPQCRLVNPPEAEVCDCGYNFKAGKITHAAIPEAQKLEIHWRIVCSVAGFITLVGGLLWILAALIAASAIYSAMRKKYPGRAEDGFKWYGIGIGIALLISVLSMLATPSPK